MKNQSFLLGFTNIVCFEGLLERTLASEQKCVAVGEKEIQNLKLLSLNVSRPSHAIAQKPCCTQAALYCTPVVARSLKSVIAFNSF